MLLMPKPSEFFLAQRSSGGLQAALGLTLEVHHSFYRQHRLSVEPPEAGVFERVVAFGCQLFDSERYTLSAASPNDLETWNLRCSKWACAIPLRTMAAMAAPKVLLSRLRFALKNCPRQAVFAALRFIKAEVIHPDLITTPQTPLECPVHDAPQLRPVQSQQTGRGRQTQRDVNHLHRMILKGQRPPRVVLGPRNRRLLQRRHSCPDRCPTLQRVKMWRFYYSLFAFPDWELNTGLEPTIRKLVVDEDFHGYRCLLD